MIFFRTSKSGSSRSTRAFTLPEMMLSMSLLTVVLGGVLSAHIFGIKMFELTKAKLGANDDARRAVTKLATEIRAAKSIQVGTGDQSSFQQIDDGSPQQGTAIQIYASTNTNTFVRYYMDTSEKALKRVTDSAPTPSVIAISVTNTVVFTSEDFAGNVLTDNQNNRVIGLTLQFYQLQYPIVPIGPGQYYDFYQLRTRITRRALE
jgi:prepilin-type N-terminal cleavage/methylation domain-containing protein